MSSQINRLKKVLFVITQSEIGGAQRFFLELLPRLSKEKYEISVAVGSTAAPSQEFADSLAEQSFKVFTLNHLKRDSGFLFWQDWRAVFELRKLIKNIRPDVLFLNSSKAGFIGSLATVFPSKLTTKNQKLTTIYRIGGWTFNDPWPWWKKRFWIVLEKISAKWKNLIIVNNQHDLEQAKSFKIAPTEKLVLIYNALDPYKIALLEKEEAKLKIFEKLSKVSGRIFQAKTMVGTIANFYPSKGLEYLVQAADLLKDRKDLIFLIIGDGLLRASLEQQIKDLGLENKVFLLGHLENARQYLPAFDIFLLPSVKEGFPWVVLEAMSAKLPMIATKVGAVPEIIEDGKNGLLVSPAQPGQIAEKIKELLANDYLKKEVGLQGHQTVLFKFSAEKMTKEIEAIL
ncbi:MAG: hypothetical protein A2749_02050 [Parcubacteria group bacterium RIFCSPHIGHO2_01_FULL_45_26]|nr:MAG: hypothetical protein A2749_02050 [Parcubacteria group bacterium RIFCSPHIGHO2_01_FULL_45_26]